MNYQSLPFDITILESDLFTIPETRTVRRTWYERLLSCPWRPWVVTETVTVRVPDPTVYLDEMCNAIHCHPATARAIREEMRKR